MKRGQGDGDSTLRAGRGPGPAGNRPPPAPRRVRLAVWGALAWNGLWAADCTLVVSRCGFWLGMMPPQVAVFLAALPFWVKAAWALGAWGALAGSLLLVAGVRHAAVAYALSFAGAVASFTWVYAHGAPALGPGFAVVALVVACGVFAQLWLSRAMFWRGWLA